MLDTAFMLGAIAKRFSELKGEELILQWQEAQRVVLLWR